MTRIFTNNTDNIFAADNPAGFAKSFDRGSNFHEFKNRKSLVTKRKRGLLKIKFNISCHLKILLFREQSLIITEKIL